MTGFYKKKSLVTLEFDLVFYIFLLIFIFSRNLKQ
jgi:hypothetical protein